MNRNTRYGVYHCDLGTRYVFGFRAEGVHRTTVTPGLYRNSQSLVVFLTIKQMGINEMELRPAA